MQKSPLALSPPRRGLLIRPTLALPTCALVLLGCGSDGSGGSGLSVGATVATDTTQASASTSEALTDDATAVPTSTASEPGSASEPASASTGTASDPASTGTASDPASTGAASDPGTASTGSDAGTDTAAASETGAVSSDTQADTGSTGAESSTGGGEGCTPGASEACYGGPDGTEGVGACAAGLRTCEAGGVFGPCEGEVLPAADETCADAGDVDCDGVVTKCTGAGLWAKGFGENYNQRGWEIASDAAGRIAVVGSMTGTIDFGGGPLTPGGKTSTYLALLGPDGGHVWSHAYAFSATNGNELYVSDLAFDGAGNLYMAGQFNGSVNFGAGAVAAGWGPSDIYLTKFDPAGKALWTKVWGDDGADGVAALAIGPDDGVVLCGDFHGQIAFGAIKLFGAGDLTDVYVASFDGAGAPKWARRFGDSSYQNCRGVGVDAAGEVALATEIQGSADFGGELLKSAGVSDLGLARFDADGEHLWSALHGNDAAQLVHAMAMDSAGATIVSGHSNKPVDLGGGLVVTGNQADIFLAKYDADGAFVWAKFYARTNNQVLQDLAVDSSDHILAVGHFTGTVNFGGADLVSPNPDFDAFALKVAPNGAHVWSQAHPDADEKQIFQQGRGVAVDPQDNVLLTGLFNASIKIAGKELLSNEADAYSDVYVAKLAP